MLQPSSKQKNKELKQDKSSFMYQIGKKKKKKTYYLRSIYSHTLMIQSLQKTLW